MNQADGAVAPPGQKHFSFSLLHAAHAVEARLEAALGEAGLSLAKFSALSKLAEAGEPLTLSDLAARLSCVRSNITQLVDRLEADGLVRRVADPDDRRSIRAELTPLGAERQLSGSKALAEAQEELSRLMTPRDLNSLEAALDALG